MLAAKRVSKAYDVLLKFLKFSLKNSSNPEYRGFSLVENYLQLLRELAYKLKKLINYPFNYLESDYEELLRIIFKDELQEYKDYIDDDEKKELIRYFELIIDLADYAIDREGEVEVGIIDQELKLVISCLAPFLRESELI
ncbi:hypothetical protein ES705_24293 [subsurface metagenome]